MRFPKPIAVCGQVKIHTPIVTTNKNYEYAAWWQTTSSDLGVYDVGLVKNYEGYSLNACIPATITDAYFGSHWGGVTCGKYDKSRDVGQKVREWINVDAIHGIKTYNWHYTEGTQWIFSPEFWPLINEYYTELLHKSMKGINEAYNTHMGVPDQIYDYSGFNMIAHFGENAALAVRNLEEIKKKMSYLNDGYNNTNVGPSIGRLVIKDDNFNGHVYQRFDYQ